LIWCVQLQDHIDPTSLCFDMYGSMRRALPLSSSFCRSVGCILAELIGRKPIFPGRDSFHQLTLITSILGTPPPAPAKTNGTSTSSSSASSSSSTGQSSQVPRPKSSSSGPTEDFIHSLPRKPKIPFRQLYPKASPLACDLLDKLLVFEPEQRLTVEQALAHPYLEELHCEEDEPICTHLDPSEFYFEYLKLTKEDLRLLIHQEIVTHYREDLFEFSAPLDTLGSMLKNLPKGGQKGARGRPVRRKSF